MNEQLQSIGHQASHIASTVDERRTPEGQALKELANLLEALAKVSAQQFQHIESQFAEVRGRIDELEDEIKKLSDTSK